MEDPSFLDSSHEESLLPWEPPLPRLLPAVDASGPRPGPACEREVRSLREPRAEEGSACPLPVLPRARSVPQCSLHWFAVQTGLCSLLRLLPPP